MIYNNNSNFEDLFGTVILKPFRFQMQFISVKDIIPEEVTFRSKDDKNMVLVKVRAVSASFHRKTTMGEPTNGYTYNFDIYNFHNIIGD